MIFGNPVRGVIRPINWKRPAGNHEPKLTQPFKGQEPAHDGIDISCAGKSVDLLAMADGIVVFAQQQSPTDRSINVVIDHGDLRTLIGHCRKEIVSVGQRVRRGEVIAFMGETGVSTGVHAHVEVFRESDNRRLDPWALLAQNQKPRTVTLKKLDGSRIRKAATAASGVYAETHLADNSVRTTGGLFLGAIDLARPYGGTVTGGPWVLPDGTKGKTWVRIKFGTRYRFVATALAVVQ